MFHTQGQFFKTLNTEGLRWALVVSCHLSSLSSCQANGQPQRSQPSILQLGNQELFPQIATLKAKSFQM